MGMQQEGAHTADIGGGSMGSAVEAIGAGNIGTADMEEAGSCGTDKSHAIGTSG